MFLSPYTSPVRGRLPTLWPDINREFAWLLDGVGSPSVPAALASWEVTDDKDKWTFTIIAPGVAAKDVNIEATVDTVSITATRARQAEEGARPLRQERPEVTFNRTFQFPAPIDPERVDARLVEGVLTVTVPRRAEAHPTPVKVFTSRI